MITDCFQQLETATVKRVIDFIYQFEKANMELFKDFDINLELGSDAISIYKKVKTKLQL